LIYLDDFGGGATGY